MEKLNQKENFNFRKMKLRDYKKPQDPKFKNTMKWHLNLMKLMIRRKKL